MTKKTKKTTKDDELMELEDELRELEEKDKQDQKEHAKKSKKDWKNDEIEKLTEENKQLKSEIDKLNNILKNTQQQYLSLKNDFDAHVNRTKSNEETNKINMQINLLKKILPVFDDFFTSIQMLPEDIKKSKVWEWLILIWDKLLKELDHQYIQQIKTIWEAPNEEFHDILSMQNTDDETQKGKIIAEIKRWYYIKKDWSTRVIYPAKVVVWSIT